MMWIRAFFNLIFLNIHIKKNVWSGILIFLPLLCHAQEDYFRIPEKGFTSWLPAPSWDHALLSGNGTMGAMVFGYPHEETIIINHSSLYMPVYPSKKPVNQASRLNDIRKLCLDGKFEEAAKIPVELSKEEGYDGKLWNDPYIPAFDLKIEMDAENIEKYVRSVNFETGEAIVDWRQKGQIYQRKLFCSRSDTVIVMIIKGTSPVNCRLELNQRPISWEESSYLQDLVSYPEISASGNTISYRTEFKKYREESIKGYEGILKVFPTGGHTEINRKYMDIKDADEVLVLIKVEPFFKENTSNIDKIIEKFSNIPHNYQELLTSHTAIHSEMYNRVNLDLYDRSLYPNIDAEVLVQKAKTGFNRAIVEKQFQAARYNMISATGINPPNFQGIWGGSWRPPWNSVFTNDGNLPTAVSPFLMGNLPELMRSFTSYHERLMPCYRENAQRLYGCRGIFIPAHTGRHGYATHFDETWCLTFWTGGAGWAADYFYDYWLYTHDEDFLSQHAYPFMKEVAHFYEDFIITGKDGKNLFVPSYSPENNPSNSTSQAAINATMDVMITKQLLRNCIEAGKILNEDKKQLNKWVDMLRNMPEYQTDSSGTLREWLWDGFSENHNHRHVSQLYGLYNRIDPDILSNINLIEGAKKAIQERMRVRRNENGGQMVFGLAQMACVAANLGQKDLVKEILPWLSSHYWSNSMATYHDPGSIFNMDLSSGFQTAVIKSLVNAEPGKIQLLPAVPDEWNKGKLSGVLLYDRITMENLEWSNGTIHLTLNPAQDQEIILEVPAPIKVITITDSKTKIKMDSKNKKTAKLRLYKNKNISLKIILDNK